MEQMLVELHHAGHKTGLFAVDLIQRPSKVQVEPSGEELFLEWNSTVDDSGRLRGCIICSGEVFRERTFRQVTGVVVVLAFAGAVAGILGLVTTWVMLIAMTFVLLLDIAILLLGRPRLVCYTCGTRYKKLSIAPYPQRWDSDRNEQLQRTADSPRDS